MPANNTGIVVGWLAGRFPGKIGHLFSPGSQRGPYPFVPYSLDNGAYAMGEKWDEGKWFEMLEWAKLSGQNPRWALVPDVVGDRLRTLRKWDIYAPKLEHYGWPLAFALQDSMVPEDVPTQAQVLFVGGSTDWKWATAQMWCKEFPRVHIGRVNTYRRLWNCHDWGAESCDGTGWTRGDQKQAVGLVAYLEESTGSRKRIKQMQLEMIS